MRGARVVLCDFAEADDFEDGPADVMDEVAIDIFEFGSGKFEPPRSEELSAQAATVGEWESGEHESEFQFS